MTVSHARQFKSKLVWEASLNRKPNPCRLKSLKPTLPTLELLVTYPLIGWSLDCVPVLELTF